MAHIQVLDKHVAELIAAGEVVERPSSVVKELVENAIDAGASVVSVAIRGGGTQSIVITDNGGGIAREDVATAFLRHATSKVRVERDLDAIGTLGFRGEALASIAAVSRVELVTRTAAELAGTRYCLEGGEEQLLEDIGCPQGTTITVQDLFYNVPARMKFLKKDVSEGNAIAGVIDRLALSHPEVSFRFTREGREERLTPGDGDLRACIYAVFGKAFSDGLLPLDFSYGGIHTHGYVSKPTAPRANRTMQHFFINGRYVKTRTAMAALEQAYKGALMAGKFPSCVLHLDMPPETVDANVHPAKIEVRFTNEKPVFDCVYLGVQSALQRDNGVKHGTVAKPAATPKPAPAVQQMHIPSAPVPPAVPAKAPAHRQTPLFHTSIEAARPAVLRDGGPSYLDIVRDLVEDEPPPAVPEPAPPAVAPPAVPAEPEPAPAPEPADAGDEAPIRYLGELFRTYLLAEMGDSLYVIDKHAAHERILYDQLKTQPLSDAQQLLTPVTVALSPEEYTVLGENGDLLQQAGFEVEDFGDNTLLVRALPMILAQDDAAALLQEIAGGLLTGRRGIQLDKLDWVRHSVACRAAVKGGNVNTPLELARLAERVLRSRDIRTCPHGRPVCLAFTRQELEKQFGRLV